MSAATVGNEVCVCPSLVVAFVSSALSSHANATITNPLASQLPVMDPRRSTECSCPRQLGFSSQLPFAEASDSKDGFLVKGNHCFPERPALLVPLIIILYLQYASAAI